MLGSTATKREARAYLSRFDIGKATNQPAKPNSLRSKDAGVNLGSLYLPARVVDANHVFSISSDQSRSSQEAIHPLHIALVKIRAPQSINEPTLHGIGHTLSQLAQLGLSCVVVVDPSDGKGNGHLETAKLSTHQADRIVQVIEAYGGQGARRIDSAIGVFPVNNQTLSSVKILGSTQISDRDVLLAPLQRGIIPVLVPVGFDSSLQSLVPVIANEVILALTRDFAGLQNNPQFKENDSEAEKKVKALRKQISLDRIIILEPLGGIPSSTNKTSFGHIFINLEQEYDSIKNDLMAAEAETVTNPSPSGSPPLSRDAFLSSNPVPKSVACEPMIKKSKSQRQINNEGTHSWQVSSQIHLQNLDLIKQTLALLPPSSSAFLTTPGAVANSQSRPPVASQGPRVRTRRQRNPLIHNLLTDKPVFSSSLPSNRLKPPSGQASLPTIISSQATFFKRGMPVSIFPDPFVQKWAPPSTSRPSINMSDPRIDLSRLVHLINDSFGRKLDVLHYLNRIRDRLAGFIIAGEYEGGAILTWETPAVSSSDHVQRVIPYLDKFAVLKRSQGAGGVADVIFKTLVRECFPDGVCWRSRKDNPVNKWYFERAKGTWEIPGTNWTMFWTTDGIELNDEVFSDYETVCRVVEPSWADHQSILD